MSVELLNVDPIQYVKSLDKPVKAIFAEPYDYLKGTAFQQYLDEIVDVCSQKCDILCFMFDNKYAINYYKAVDRLNKNIWKDYIVVWRRRSESFTEHIFNDGLSFIIFNKKNDVLFNFSKLKTDSRHKNNFGKINQKNLENYWEYPIVIVDDVEYQHWYNKSHPPLIIYDHILKLTCYKNESFIDLFGRHGGFIRAARLNKKVDVKVIEPNKNWYEAIKANHPEFQHVENLQSIAI